MEGEPYFLMETKIGRYSCFPIKFSFMLFMAFMVNFICSGSGPENNCITKKRCKGHKFNMFPLCLPAKKFLASSSHRLNFIGSGLQFHSIQDIHVYRKATN